MRYYLNAILHGGNTRRLVFTLVALVLLVTLLLLPFGSASASWLSRCCDGGECCIENDCRCPQCYGRGEPGGVCDDCGGELCDNCGNCGNCGVSPCPVCRVCPDCGSHNLCGACFGCLDCGTGREPGCPECGDNALINAENDSVEPHTPLLTVGGLDVFLFAPPGVSAWAILSLLLTVAGVIVSVSVIVRAVRQKKDENKVIDEHSSILRNVDAFDNEKVARVVEDKERYNKRRRLGALSVMYFFAAAAVLLIILVQDFKGVIVLFDWWVIPHAALFSGVIISGMYVFRRYEEFPGALSMRAVSHS